MDSPSAINDVKFGIGICGVSGSGKSTVAEYIKQEFGFQIAHTGNIIRRMSLILFGSESKDCTQTLYDCLSTLPETTYIEAAVRQLNYPLNRVIWDSVRSPEEARFCQEIGFKLLRLSVSEEVQLKRLKNRGQKFSKASLNDPSELDCLQFQQDWIVDTSSSLDCTYLKIDEIMQQFCD